MLFPTAEFGIFFLIVFTVSWLIKDKQTARKFFLTASSYFFYGFWDWRFMFLLLFCSVTSYFFGLMLGNTRDTFKRKTIISYSVVLNLGVLGFFKYYGFFTNSFNDLMASFNINTELPLLEVILPVGISFFTFQAMSYVIDVYRNKIEPSRSVIDVLFYISFFPQLVAGPIVRAAHFFPQLKTPPDSKNILAGRAITLITGGLFKKVIIANYIAIEIVDPVFDNPAIYSSLDTLFAVYGYAVQIYCDFSAYSDIAIGIASLMGYHFPDNFNHPYRAESIQDFWRRWHISLSTWLRDYLYIPLGGSKNGRFNTYRNLAITMLLGGLWHGAAWNFVFWGALHGFGLAIERFIRERKPLEARKEKSMFGRIVSGFLVFHFVCLSWVFFRASSFETAMDFLNSIIMFDLSSQMITPFVLVLLFIGMIMHYIPKEYGIALREQFVRLPIAVQGLVAGIIILAISAMGPQGVAPFIYFQF